MYKNMVSQKMFLHIISLSLRFARNYFYYLGRSVITEESWSDEQLCINNKLWYAL